jgi:hypothetical protein
MNLLAQLSLGSLLIGLTVGLHAVALDVIIRFTGHIEVPVRAKFKNLWRAVLSGGFVVVVFGVHVAMIWIWTFVYLLRSCHPLDNITDAVYFSTTSYTTMGSSIMLGKSCHMLSGIESANGFILISWTTAFIFEVVSQLYRREVRSL